MKASKNLHDHWTHSLAMREGSGAVDGRRHFQAIWQGEHGRKIHSGSHGRVKAYATALE